MFALGGVVFLVPLLPLGWFVGVVSEGLVSWGMASVGVAIVGRSSQSRRIG